MSTLITLCRDVEESDTDCIEDHEGSDVTLAAPCKVVMEPCDKQSATEHVGPEAESSAVRSELIDDTCCDC